MTSILYRLGYYQSVFILVMARARIVCSSRGVLGVDTVGLGIVVAPRFLVGRCNTLEY